MPEAFPEPPRTRPRPHRAQPPGWTLPAQAGAAALLLTAGAAGLLTAPVAVLGAVLFGVGLPGLRLSRMAVTAHARTGDLRNCRGAGLLAVTSVGGATAVCVAAFTPPAARTGLALSGLILALAGHLAAILLLPGVAETWRLRLRRVVDGLSLGISLIFAGWLLSPVDTVPSAVLFVELSVIGAGSIIVVTALAMRRQRPAVLYCGGGSIALLVGLAAPTVCFAYGTAGWLWCLATAPAVGGMLLLVIGAQRAQRAGSRPVTSARGRLTAYPLLTVPAVVAALAAAYHVATQGSFDRTSVLLGLAVIPTLVVREMMAAADVRSYARRLSIQEAHFRSLVSGGNDLTLTLGDDLRVRWQSPAAARLFGLADAQVLGRPFIELMHPEDIPEVVTVLTGVVTGRLVPTSRTPLVTARLRDGHGRWRDTESTVSDQRTVPEVGALVVHVRDVGERVHLERRLYKLGFTDQLTGLANRRELMRQIANQRDLPGHPGALLIIDLHGLVGVNEQYGREVSDAVLVEVGRRLRDTVEPDDVVARLSGDEFAVITVAGPMLAYGTGARLVAALREPCQLPGAVVQLQTSIGMAEVAGGAGADDVLRRADLARRRARQLGRNRVEWYDSYLEQQLVRRLDLERELPGAAERGELDVVYQPVVDLVDGKPVGVEALLRWRSPVLGTVLPAELLAVARELSLLGHIGRWARATACRQLASWSREGHGLWLSVNVAPAELAATTFVADLMAMLAAQGIGPERLVVEVAESLVAEELAAAETPQILAQLANLRAHGVRIALDDFGAGQASIAQLRRLPLDVVKIDRSLVADAGAGPDSVHPMLEAVAGLGRRFGLEIVAEGLETDGQVSQAQAAGCRFGQGYALARPAPAERTEAYIADFPTPSH
ncbi:bifunctional diguanylate cyclase/phosphodiesterase [Solwaraspora sp. WMMD937]|uniref:putative bifunctional diguanylate cyclase/phosphodiesterase n=1 Tax=Solwaraspora sp. WMMD937 TaxID=3016090 RepID=UPI00249AF474|nr:bifunctional diguanylate cyclase/phosphodiesterase [Solwaraspora sp. WMMD937]WFE24319.1 bifunctional diguanylate cyclase/phosphodiesterase [Solwaraspora sp. WMMD937]